MLIESHNRFRGSVISVNVETVRLPNGSQCDLEIVHHPGGAAVLAEDEHQRFCMLRQFRHAAGGWIWELPAGKLEIDEPPQETARRELIEEGGVKARSWRELGTVLSSPGVFTEVVHLYHACDLAPADIAPEPNEVFEVHWLARSRLQAMIVRGEINDSKTCVAWLRYLLT
ncbi:MAG: NUDIX hydrolase [Steroidobacteraceae bacterium]